MVVTWTVVFWLQGYRYCLILLLERAVKAYSMHSCCMWRWLVCLIMLIGCLSMFLMWIIDHEFDYDLIWGTAALEHGRLSVNEWLGMESLQTFQGCLNMVRANHATTLVTERALQLLRYSNLIRFQDDFLVWFLEWYLTKVKTCFAMNLQTCLERNEIALLVLRFYNLACL